MLLILNDNKLYKSPIDPSPQRVIDIGTGTGIWAMQVAHGLPMYPVRVLTDSAATSPTRTRVQK